MKQYTGSNEHGEFLVTVFPAEGNKPASAEVCWRADQWESFDAPVRLSAVPVGSVA